jgi:hypothetical protein
VTANVREQETIDTVDRSECPHGKGNADTYQGILASPKGHVSLLMPRKRHQAYVRKHLLRYDIRILPVTRHVHAGKKEHLFQVAPPDEENINALTDRLVRDSRLFESRQCIY